MGKKIGVVCLLTAGLLTIAGITAVMAESVKVGIYCSELREDHKGIYDSLKSETEIKVNYISDLDNSTLSGLDVLVIPQMRDVAEIKEKMEQIRAWVKDGHGLMAAHDMVGYRNHPAIFPEIAKGIGNPFNKQTGYGKECIVVRNHPITEGLKIKEVVEHDYYDQVLMIAGKKGAVIAREAIILDKQNRVTGEPVIVAGEIGKGRYVAYGLYNAAAPKGQESKLFINSIRWLSSNDRYNLDKELGTGVKIARAKNGQKKVKEKIDAEEILINAIESFEADWRISRAKQAPKIIESNFKQPIEFSEEELTGSKYSRVPEGWAEIDLSGVWKIKKIKGTEKNPSDDEGTVKEYYRDNYDDKEWEIRPVPSSWDNKDYKNVETIILQQDPISGDGVGTPDDDFTGVGWYRKKVYIPKNHQGRRIVLHFEGCDYETRVWINSKYIDRHTGGRTSFEFDITEAVEYGKENTIVVRVYDIDTQTPYGYPMYEHDAGRTITGGMWGETYLSIRPDVYTVRTLIVSHLSSSEIEIDCWLNNTGKTRTAILKAKVIPSPPPLATGKGETTQMNLGEVNLLHGISKYNFRIKLKDPILWSLDNPYLYVLELIKDKEILAKERFGFREFKAEGEYFYLNGKRVFLSSANVRTDAFYMNPRIVIKDDAKFMTRYLLGIKSYNCNMIYKWTSLFPQKLYDLCDELGLLVYQEWDAVGNNFHNPVMEEGWNKGEKEIEAWICDTYNHPSIVMYSLGGELFEGSTPKPYKKYNDLLNPAYELVKSIDKQNRPVCPSSGRNTWRILKSKTDMHDIHVYPGSLGGSWTDEKTYIKEVWKYAGYIHKDKKPVIQFELGAARWWNQDLEALKKLFKDEKETGKMNRKEFVRLLQKMPVNYLGTRQLSNFYGVRRYLDDISRGNDWRMGAGFQIYTWKNLGEEIRRLGPLIQGYSPNTDAFSLTELMENGKVFPGRSYRGGRTTGDLSKKVYIESEAYQAFKRVNNPNLICLNKFDKDVFAGRELKVKIYTINDIDELSKDWLVRVVIRDKEGNILEDKEADIGKVKGFKRKLIPYTYSIPSHLKTGFYRIELVLYEGEKIVSDNYYEFFVLGREDNLNSLPVSEKIALYDTRSRLYDEGIQTKNILKGLKIKHELINNFNELNRYKIIIIGADSLDAVVKNSGDKIKEWIKQGGKLLQFEQRLPGAVPYWRKLNLLSFNTHHILIEIVELNHPIFKGLSYRNMERWNDLPDCKTPGELFEVVLGPLDESVLATGCTSVPRTTTKSSKMVISEVEIGKGKLLMIQVKATQRYNKDSVATKLIQNILEYFLGEE